MYSFVTFCPLIQEKNLSVASFSEIVFWWCKTFSEINESIFSKRIVSESARKNLKIKKKSTVPTQLLDKLSKYESTFSLSIKYVATARPIAISIIKI
jgi:hypothetical protein